MFFLLFFLLLSDELLGELDRMVRGVQVGAVGARLTAMSSSRSLSFWERGAASSVVVVCYTSVSTGPGARREVLGMVVGL